MITSLLKDFGLSEKEQNVYLSVLEVGPAAVRTIAVKAGVNRGTCYDILKSLMNQGLVSYFHKEKNQYFVAEDPEKLHQALANKVSNLQSLEQRVTLAIPRLRALQSLAGRRPVVKFYEGGKGIKIILQDVLTTMEKLPTKEYLVYSSAELRPHLYRDFPDFTQQRIKRGITVKAIAIGEGGSQQGLDQRRWLNKKQASPTYILIYENKVAMISLTSDQQLIGVLIEDSNLAKTQKIIHDFLWQKLA